MHGTLIKVFNNESNQKMYKLDFKIYDTKYGKIKMILNNLKFKPGWELDGEQDFVDTVVIYDADTHFDRLVFPVINVVNTETGEKKQTHALIKIAGEETMMIYGGDISSMLEPEEYFEQLYELNKQYQIDSNIINKPVTKKQSQYIEFMCHVLKCDNPNCKTLEEARMWISKNQEEYRRTLDEWNAWQEACYESDDWGCR